MLQCPTEIRHIHKFKHDDRFYAADLYRFQLFEINQIAWDAVELAPLLETQELIDQLSETYARDSVLETLELLGDFQSNGLIFPHPSSGDLPEADSERLKIYIPQGKGSWFLNPESVGAGTNVALYHMTRNLSKIADLYLSGETEEELAPGIYTMGLSTEELQQSPRRFKQRLNLRGVSGILAHQAWGQYELAPFFREIDLPIVVQNHAPRGHAGLAISTTLFHHSLMRPYDAFTSPSDSVAKYYARFVGDTRQFYTLPNGVDADTFKPLNKAKAKREIATLLEDSRVEEKLTVGFLSRFQPEKGAHVFIQLAEMHPDMLFLVGGNFLLRPSYGPLPDNLIYAGFLPRKQLPTLYNAFDIYCFPSMAAEETFGLTLLEAMACGVPPVVPRFDGLPEVVGEAGVIVPAEAFSEDMAGFAAAVSAAELSQGIVSLLEDNFRHELGAKARHRALTFTWEKTAKYIVQLFEKLNRIKQNQRTSPDFSIAFVPYYDAFQNQVENRALLLNLTPSLEAPLQQKSGYVQTMEEGLALTLLKRHTSKEVEAVLTHVLDDKSKASEVVERVENFLNTLA